MAYFQRIAAMIIVVTCSMWAGVVAAQDLLNVGTVTRAPFSMPTDDGGHEGFSIDLLNDAATAAEKTVQYTRFDSFGDMLAAVQDGTVDGAIANISITAERERVMDFSQPIFDAGIQVMLHPTPDGGSQLLSVLFTRDVGMTVLGAICVLFGCGMLMWFFERKRQPYFDLRASEAAFPAFWWALNVVVNGGFEERAPRSPAGRFFGVMLVISSLFIVSIFVAQITAALTVTAIQETVENLNDLDDKRVGTMDGSTTAAFLDDRGLPYRTYMDLDVMFADFESKRIDAVVFDGPILAYYSATRGAGKSRLLDRVYRPEKYGMIFPNGSPHRDVINQQILRLRENGTHDALLQKWFGDAYKPR